MTEAEKVSVAYLGMGIMGSSMATNLAKAGFPVKVWNRTPGRPGTKRAVDAGAKEVSTLESALADCAIVILCLTDENDLNDLVFREGGVADGAESGTIIVDMSTTGPECARSMASRLSERGFHFLDAPVSGGDVGARNATLTIMAGGDKAAFDKALSVFQSVGKNIHYCGESGSGQAVKLCNQVLCAVNMIAVCESITLARSLGIKPELMIEVCGSGAAGSWALSNLGPRIVAGNLEPGFMIKDMQKDLRLVDESISEAQVHLEGTDLARKKFNEAMSCLGAQGKLNGTQAMIAAYGKCESW